MRIFIDLDNTIVNLDKEVIHIANVENGTDYDYTNNNSWWWNDYTKSTGHGSRIYFENILLRKGVFLNSLPIEDAVFYINKLKKDGHEIVFLTSPQWFSNYCMVEKVEWLIDKFWTWFNPDKHLVMTTRKDLLTKKGENDILIDDSISNLDKWNGIKICKGTSCNKDYKGLRCETWQDIYELILTIEGGK